MLRLRYSLSIVIITAGGWWWVEQPGRSAELSSDIHVADPELGAALARISRPEQLPTTVHAGLLMSLPAPSPSNGPEAAAASPEFNELAVESGGRRTAHVRALLDKLTPEEYPLRFSLLTLLESSTSLVTSNEADSTISKEKLEESMEIKALLLEQLNSTFWETAPEDIQRGYRSALVGIYMNFSDGAEDITRLEKVATEKSEIF